MRHAETCVTVPVVSRAKPLISNKLLGTSIVKFPSRSPPRRNWGLNNAIMALQIQIVRASTSREINAACASFEGEQRPDALFVDTDAFFSSRRIQIVQLTAFHEAPRSTANVNIAKPAG